MLAVTGAYIQVRMNSITDPLVAVVGDYNTMGTVEWGKLYNKYTVIGTKVTLTAWPRIANDQTPYEGFLYIQFLASGTVPHPQLQQDGSGTVLSAATAVPNLPNIRYVKTSGQVRQAKSPYVVSYYRSVASVEGKSRKAITHDDDYAGVLNTDGSGDDPVVEPQFIVGYATHENGENPAVNNWLFQIDVKYYVRFHGARYPTNKLIST